jgi:hypothetical protein
MVLKGAHPNPGPNGDFVSALEAQHGINLWSVQGAEIANVTITDVYGDFIYIGNQGGTLSKNIYVHDSHMARNGRQGIGIVGAEDVLFERNVINDVRRSQIDIEPNGTSGGAHRITFRNNKFGAARLNWLANAGGCAPVSEIVLENNTLSDQAMKVHVKPPLGCRRGPFRITGNYSAFGHGSLVPLMQFLGVDGLTVRDNYQLLNPNRDMIGVYAEETCNVNVGNNTFPNALHELVVVTYAGCK